LNQSNLIAPSPELIKTLKVKLDKVLGEIQEASIEGPTPLLLAVSKKQSESKMAAMILNGQHHFGENYLQEAVTKKLAIEHWMQQAHIQSEIVWHYIGNVQSNKTRPIAEHFDWVHTITSSKQLHKLNSQRSEDLARLNLCIQVNIDNEPQKQGVTADQLPSLVDEALSMERLRLRGLMCLPSLEAPGTSFKTMAKLFHNIKDSLSSQEDKRQFDTLSMGTSNDLLTAVAAGSTIVRIGTALFGQRES